MKTSDKLDQLMPALVKAQSEMGSTVTKDSKNPFFKSTFATLNAVLDSTVHILNKHKIFVTQPPAVEANGQQIVETVLFHESGQFIASSMQVTVAKANDPQAVGSGVSYARRYTLMSMLSLGAEDDDGESAMGRGKTHAKPEPAKPEALKQPTSAIHTSTATPVVDAAVVPTKPEAPKRSSFKKPAPAPAAAPAVTTTTSDDGWE